MLDIGNVEILRSLVDAITLTPENGRLHIDLRGQLAGILALASDSKKPVTGPGDGLLVLEQIKLVAGAGFEPATFRL